MALKTSQKRSLDEGAARNNSFRKKLKTEIPKSAPKAAPRKVRLDQLAWNEVSAPDNLEDFEGFFGLEEIEGVDVVRDGTNGHVSYKVAGDSEGLADSLKAEDIENLADDDEWEGLGDEREETEETKAVESKVSDISTKDKPKKKQTQKERKAAKLLRDGGKVAEGKLEGSKELTEEDVVDAPMSPSADVKSSNKKAQKEQKLKKKIAGNKEADVASAFSLLEDGAESEEDVDISAWKSLKLSPAILSSLAKLKFPQPTAIQSASIPEVLAGHDLIGKAPTGSGKTLSFGIPILEHWLSNKQKHTKQIKEDEGEEVLKQPTALIVLPTRELAHQIEDHLSALFSHATILGDDDKPYIATLTGGLSIQKQRRQLKLADIIVATPGRLWEVISESKGLLEPLQKVKFLVIDEADRLLGAGHFKELEEILDALDREVVEEATGKESESESDEEMHDLEINARSQRQTLVFSATFSKDLHQKLAKRAKHYISKDSKADPASMEYLLRKLKFHSTPDDTAPIFIDVNPESQMATGLREGLVECTTGTEKDLYLYTLLLYHPRARSLVFVNSISAVRRLVPFLQNLGLNALSLHSQMAQKARLRSLERFSAEQKGTANGAILVATDVAARGLDIPSVHLVIHYHLPRAADMYVHRSGRTARGDSTGSSILICAPEEAAGVRRLITQVHSFAAKKAAAGRRSRAHLIQTLEIDKRVVTRLKPRATLAKTLADSAMAKEKKRSEDSWMKEAAEELGVEYDSEDFGEGAVGGKRARGRGREKREKEAREMTKDELASAKAQLRELLRQRVNVGVSEKYLTASGVDINKLLEGRDGGAFLGSVPDLGFDV